MGSVTQHPAEMPEFTEDEKENEQGLEAVDTYKNTTLVHWHPDVAVSRMQGHIHVW